MLEKVINIFRKANALPSLDRSELSLAKEELEKAGMIINSMDEAVVVTTKNQAISFANLAFNELFLSGKGAIGKSILDYVRVPTLFENIKSSLDHRKTYETEFHFEGKILSARSSQLGGGNSPLCLTVIVDITRLKHLEELRRDFSANVSHQMKTPLTSIIGYSETLLSGGLEEKGLAKDFIKIIHSESLKLKELIDDVLSLARIESPSFQLSLEKFSSVSLINDVVEGFITNKKGITFDIDTKGFELSTDIKAFRQILHNLIDNAIKYTPEGGSVTVKCGRTTDHRPQTTDHRLQTTDHRPTASKGLQSAVCGLPSVVISVCDTGPGIESSERDRIFERFYRGSSSSNIEGSGLGLAIVRHLLEKLGGSIEVESTENEGSKFTVILPQ